MLTSESSTDSRVLEMAYQMLSFIVSQIVSSAVAAAVVAGTFHGCPESGDATSARTKALDVLKNRSQIPTVINPNIILQNLIKYYHDDRNLYKETDAITLTGVVITVGSGGSESASCHTSDEALRDTHIHISLGSKRPHIFVTEVTGRWREAQGEAWSQANLKKLIGKQVEITGWMMLDIEHISQSEDTHSPGDKKNWRQTAWEIHPITNIVVK